MTRLGVWTGIFCSIFLFTTNRLVGASKVLELSDRFIDVYRDGSWFVMFYAPWCGHCKKLDPVWQQVAQSVYTSNIRLGKVDCTRFPNVATEFQVKGFPTMIFMKDGQLFHYNGDRTKDALVDYSERIARPAIQKISDGHDMKNIIKTKNFFLYVGQLDGAIWEAFNASAHEFQPFIYFYSTTDAVLEASGAKSSESSPKILVFKDGTHYIYTNTEPLVLENRAAVDSSSSSEEEEDYVETNTNELNPIRRWVNHERFPNMMKITAGNFHQVLKIQKYIVVAVLEEDKVGRLTKVMREYKEGLEQFSLDHREVYHEKFLFSWVGAPDLINSVAMTTLPVPSLIVINATSFHHHLPEQHMEILTTENLAEFLNRILQNDVHAFGGNGVLTRLYRMYYDSVTTLKGMWQGNPVLTTVILGLPLGFLCLICYSIWCSDIMDADDDEQTVREKED